MHRAPFRRLCATTVINPPLSYTPKTTTTTIDGTASQTYTHEKTMNSEEKRAKTPKYKPLKIKKLRQKPKYPQPYLRDVRLPPQKTASDMPTQLFKLSSERKKNRVPTIKTWRNAIKALGAMKPPRIGIAIGLVKDMNSFKKYPDPNLSIYNHMLSMYADVKSPQQALDLYHAMKDSVGVNRTTFIQLFRSMKGDFCRLNYESKKLYELWREADAFGISKNDDMYVRYIKVLGHAFQWKEALRVFEEMRSAEYTFRMKKDDEHKVEAMKKDYPWVRVEADDGNVYIGGTELYKQQQAERERKKAASATAVNAVEKVEYIKVTRPFILRRRAYDSIIGALARSGEIERCKELFAEMSACEHITPDHVTYTMMLMGFGAAGDWRGALDMLEAMEKNGITADMKCYAFVLDALRLHKKEEGRVSEGVSELRWKQAMEIYSQLTTGGIKLDIVFYAALFRCLSSHGQWALALELFRKNEDMQTQEELLWKKSNYFNSVLSACAAGSQATKATLVLEMMRAEGVEATIESVTYVICACSRAGQWEKALGVLSQYCPETTEQEETSDFRVSEEAFYYALVALRTAKQWLKAMRILEVANMRSVQLSESAYLALVDMLEINGRSTESVAVVKNGVSHSVFNEFFNISQSECSVVIDSHVPEFVEEGDPEAYYARKISAFLRYLRQEVCNSGTPMPNGIMVHSSRRASPEASDVRCVSEDGTVEDEAAGSDDMDSALDFRSFLVEDLNDRLGAFTNGVDLEMDESGSVAIPSEVAQQWVALGDLDGETYNDEEELFE